MKAKTRRKLEMAVRALAFLQEHPDPSEGYAASVASLQECVRRGNEFLSRQLKGILEVHSTSARKRDLRNTMRGAHLAHLRYIARIAARDLPELREKFALRRGSIPYRDFRAAARSIATEAQRRKDLLVPHGLVETILQSLTQSLDEFDRAVERGIDARRAHVGASAGLDEVAKQAVLIVKALDRLNRYRFANQPALIAEWATVSNVIATPRPAAGDISPAA